MALVLGQVAHKLCIQVFQVLAEHVRGCGDVQNHGDLGAFASHLENRVGQVGGLGANLLHRVMPALLAPEFQASVGFWRGVEFLFAHRFAPTVFFLVRRAFTQARAKRHAGCLVLSDAVHPVADHAVCREVGNLVFISNAEGHAQNLGPRLEQCWLVARAGNSSVVHVGLHNGLHYLLHRLGMGYYFGSGVRALCGNHADCFNFNYSVHGCLSVGLIKSPSASEPHSPRVELQRAELKKAAYEAARAGMVGRSFLCFLLIQHPLPLGKRLANIGVVFVCVLGRLLARNRAE